MDPRRDIFDRLETALIPYFVTGSEAMAILGLDYRATNDIDLVLDLEPDAYDTRLRLAFEPDYLVASLLHVDRRWMGSAIRSSGDPTKADFVIRDPDAWGRAALDRATVIDDPAVGAVPVSTAEDLLIAKLEFADGNLDGLQGRDIAKLIASGAALDEAYIRAHATRLGVSGLLDEALRRAGR